MSLPVFKNDVSGMLCKPVCLDYNPVKNVRASNVHVERTIGHPLHHHDQSVSFDFTESTPTHIASFIHYFDVIINNIFRYTRKRSTGNLQNVIQNSIPPFGNVVHFLIVFNFLLPYISPSAPYHHSSDIVRKQGC